MRGCCGGPSSRPAHSLCWQTGPALDTPKATELGIGVLAHEVQQRIYRVAQRVASARESCRSEHGEEVPQRVAGLIQALGEAHRHPPERRQPGQSARAVGMAITAVL